MRKYFFLLFGVLGVILLSISGFGRQQHKSAKADIVVDQTSCFEAGTTDYMWSLEKTETASVVSNETHLTHQKKRGYDTFCRFFKHSNKVSLPITFVFEKPESRINLFLTHHYSLSLWQAFLL